MKRILFTIPNFKTAGSQFVLLELYKRIDRKLFKPYILVEKYPDTFPDEIEENERLFITEKVGKRSYIDQLAALLKDKQIDLLHSWDYKSNSIEALACRKAAVVYLYTKKNNAWSKRWFAKSLLSKHVVYNNPEMKQRFFSNIFLERKASFIPHGVDTTVFKPIGGNRKKDHFVIGCVGVLNSNKNQLLCLEALRELPNDVRIHFYGKEDKAYRAKLDSYIHTHNLDKQILFGGYVKNADIPNVMSMFDVLVLASKQEGLPLTIMEGMACGVPVLSSSSGGGARYLLKQNAGGYVFEDKNELVNQLFQLYQEPKLGANLAINGRARIVEHFSIEKEVNTYKELYLSLLK